LERRRMNGEARHGLIALVSLCVVLILVGSQISVIQQPDQNIPDSNMKLIMQEEEEEDEGDDDGLFDGAGDLGVAAIVLFGIGCLYVIVFQGFMLSKKLLPDNERNNVFKKKYQEFFIKVRRPLYYVHWLAGVGAISVLTFHMIGLVTTGEEPVLIGIITTILYVFYIVSGAIVKLPLAFLKKLGKFRLVLGKIHRSLLLFFVIIAIHAVHISLA